MGRLLFFPLSLALLCAAQAVAGNEPIELTFWPVVEADIYIHDLVQEFERRNPDIRVIRSQSASLDKGGDNQRLLCGIAGGDPPDVVEFARFAIAEWAPRGALTALDPFIAAQDPAAPDAIRPEEYYRAAWDESVFDGTIYAIPSDIDTRPMFYNKDLLIRAGLVDATGEAVPPRTWDDLRHYTNVLTQRVDSADPHSEIVTLGYPPFSLSGFSNCWLYMYAFMNGGRFVSEDGRRCTLDAPPNIEALDYMVQLTRDIGGALAVHRFLSAQQGGLMDPFISGRMAMRIDVNYLLNFIAALKPEMNFGVAPPPVPPGHPVTSWSGGWCWVIPAKSKHPDAAWRLIRWLASPEAQALKASAQYETQRAAGQLYIPFFSGSRRITESLHARYVEGNPDLPPRYRTAVREILDLLLVSEFRPVTPVGQLLWNEHIRATEEALYNVRSVTEALRQHAAVVQKALDRYHAPPSPYVLRWEWVIGLYLVFVALLVAGIYVHHARRSRSRGYFRLEYRAGPLFALPWIVGFVAFTGGPIVFSLVISFCDYDVFSPPRWIGLDNYRTILFDDALFWKSLWNTVYMVVGVPVGMVVGLAIAMLLDCKVRGLTVYRTLFYLPAIMPAVAASMLWLWLMHPSQGAINQGLATLGLEGPAWLQDAAWSKPAIILMGLWGAGGGMIIWLAGLKGIPEVLYEAARIDGANVRQRFVHVTLPMLSPYIFFSLIMGIIGTFQIFAQAYIMTQGGPVDSTLFYVYYLFNHAFRYMRMGYASALAWILFVIILVLTIIQIKVAPRWVHYTTE